MFVGHTTVRQTLEASLPKAFMLQGPSSVGKGSLIQHLVECHKFQRVDVMWRSKLTADTSRELRDFALKAPFGKAGKLLVARLDGATESSMNVLLKILEEPPRRVRFALLSSGRPLNTIRSRVEIFPMGLLSATEIFEVLTKKLGMGPGMARSAAQVARGQISRALASGDRYERAKLAVANVLRALSNGDAVEFEAATRQWDQEETALLEIWIVEALTGQWAQFSPSISSGMHLKTVSIRKMLYGLRSVGSPRLRIRAGLQPLFD